MVQGLIEIRRTFDYELVSAIANLPENYRITKDDFAPPMGEFQATRSDRIYYLLADDPAECTLGFGCFIPLNAVCYDAHVCFVPIAYGRADICFRGMLGWMWKHSEARKVVGSVAEFNRLAIRFAMRCGMKMEGVNFKSFLKDGTLHDQILLGISKPCHS